MIFVDARLPIRFGALSTRRPDEAVLTDGPGGVAPPMAVFTPDAAPHPAGCACCVGQSGAAQALAALFRERAVSSGPLWRGILAVVSDDGETAVRAALGSDSFASGRYRLA